MIRLIVDSAADYTLAELKEKNIELIPLIVTLNENTYLDNVELGRDQLYEFLTTTNGFPKTSQPSPETFYSLFAAAKEKGDSIICFTIASSLSGTYQCANIAKDMVDYDSIYIIDSCTATAGMQFLVNYANQLRHENLPVTEIVEKVEALKPRVKIIAALDTLEYLYRGGRLNKATAAIGDLANLKPVITLTEDGNISIHAKCIGKNKAISTILKYVETHEIDPDFPVFPMYTYGTENLEHLFSKALKKEFPIQQEFIQVGATIGSHIGPGAYGFIYVTK